MRHWDIVQVVAFGVILWVWNQLGLPDRVTMIGNVIGAVALAIMVFWPL